MEADSICTDQLIGVGNRADLNDFCVVAATAGGLVVGVVNRLGFRRVAGYNADSRDIVSYVSGPFVNKGPARTNGIVLAV